jgi:hypothetical protein
MLFYNYVQVVLLLFCGVGGEFGGSIAVWWWQKWQP